VDADEKQRRDRLMPCSMLLISWEQDLSGPKSGRTWAFDERIMSLR